MAEVIDLGEYTSTWPKAACTVLDGPTYGVVTRVAYKVTAPDALGDGEHERCSVCESIVWEVRDRALICYPGTIIWDASAPGDRDRHVRFCASHAPIFHTFTRAET